MQRLSAAPAPASREARFRRLAAPDPLALWLVDLTVAPDLRTIEQLTGEEWTRAARFRHDADRRRYVAAHGAVRSLIEEQCGLAIEAQRFDRTTLGKWRLLDAPGWHFNLSYAGDHALVGIARDRRVGVDIERHRIVSDASMLARDHFTPGERTAFARIGDGERDAAFLRGWTRKEACVKALGLGLGAPLTTLETGIDRGERTVAFLGARITVSSVDVAGGIAAAWALMPLNTPSAASAR